MSPGFAVFRTDRRRRNSGGGCTEGAEGRNWLQRGSSGSHSRYDNTLMWIWLHQFPYLLGGAQRCRGQEWEVCEVCVFVMMIAACCDRSDLPGPWPVQLHHPDHPGQHQWRRHGEHPPDTAAGWEHVWRLFRDIKKKNWPVGGAGVKHMYAFAFIYNP